MEVNPAYWHWRENGTVEIKEIPREEWGPSRADEAIVKKFRCTWKPPYHLACHLPEHCALHFESWVDKDGNRRFVPAKSIGSFLLEAAQVGQALLADRNEFDPNPVLFQDEANLFFQHAQHLREYLGRRNPLHDAGDRIENHMRMALFVLGPKTDKIEDVEEAKKTRMAAVKYVAERVQASLETHKEGSTEAFCRWIEDPKSDLVRRILRPSTCPFDREQVKAALLDLAWFSCKEVGRCIDTAMRAFCEALPEPLNDAENALFEQMYVAHSNFSDMPLVLFQERFDFIKEIVLQIWERPDDVELVPVFHRMLAYFADIIEKRREGDRRYKKRRQARDQEGQTAIEMPFVEEPTCRASAGVEQFKDIALEVARRHGFRVDLDGADWSAVLETEDEQEDPQEVAFRLLCPDRGIDEVFRVPRLEVKIVARKIQAEKDNDE